MDIEVNNNKQQASFRNGKFYHTFTPTTANQIVKLYHMGCIGDTRLNRIQLEQGTEPTGFVAPKQTTNTLSGIFKNLRDLDVKMTDPDSDFWTRIKKTARGTVEEYHTNTMKNEIVKTAEGIVERQTKTINSSVDDKINGVRRQLDTAMNNRVTALTSESKRYADGISETLSRKVDGVTNSVATVSRTVDGINNNITSLEGKVLKKNEISITNNGIQLGSGNKIDGNTIASILSVQPKSIDLISPHVRVTGDMIVNGTIEGRHVKAKTLETGHHKAGSITSDIIAANAVRAKHILVDNGLINNLVTHNAFISKLWAQDAFIKYLKTVKISATQLDTDWLSAYTGEIGGFRIGHNPNDNDFWLTGANNFECGINPGFNAGTRGAQIWAAWGDNWEKAGDNAWWVNAQGVMTCKATPLFKNGLDVYNRYIDTHGNDIQGDASGGKTTVIWWSQINRVRSSVSDRRFKTNIKPTKVKAVDLLNNIEMVEFNWKKDNKFEKIGAIAQQVQSVEESLVIHDMDDKQTYNDYLRINYYDTIPYLIKAVQELSEENNKLKNKLEELING